MIDCAFQQQQEIIGIRIEGNHLQFITGLIQGQIPKFTFIGGLRLSIGGIIKEFPELKDKEPKEIRKIGIQRFKEKIAKMETEEEIKKYIIEDLKKHEINYLMDLTLKKGFRFKVPKVKDATT